MLFSADASYFYSGGNSVGINYEIFFFIILGILCGIIGSAYIEFQRNINLIKKKLAKYNLIGENFIYTFSMCLIIATIIFKTRLLLVSDKVIIGSMINIDQTIALSNLTKENFT